MGAIGGVQLVGNGPQVVADGLLADPELLADLAVGTSLRDVDEDLELAIGDGTLRRDTSSTSTEGPAECPVGVSGTRAG